MSFKFFKNHKKNIDKKNKNGHFYIYLIVFIVSIILIGIYFKDVDNAWCILSCSIGSSLFGAIVLAYFIELADKNKEKKYTADYRKEKFGVIKLYLTKILDNIFRKYYHLNKDKLEENKIYALKYQDIKKELISKYEELETKITGEMDLYSCLQKNNSYTDGFSLLDNIIIMVNKILTQEDLFVLNNIFSTDEIEKLRSTTITFPVVDNNSLEISIHNVTFVVDQLLEIPELSELKSYYGVYLSMKRIRLCNGKKETMLGKENLDIDLDEAIKNGITIKSINN